MARKALRWLAQLVVARLLALPAWRRTWGRFLLAFNLMVLVWIGASLTCIISATCAHPFSDDADLGRWLPRKVQVFDSPCRLRRVTQRSAAVPTRVVLNTSNVVCTDAADALSVDTYPLRTFFHAKNEWARLGEVACVLPVAAVALVVGHCTVTALMPGRPAVVPLCSSRWKHKPPPRIKRLLAALRCCCCRGRDAPPGAPHAVTVPVSSRMAVALAAQRLLRLVAVDNESCMEHMLRSDSSVIGWAIAGVAYATRYAAVTTLCAVGRLALHLFVEGVVVGPLLLHTRPLHGGFMRIGAASVAASAAYHAMAVTGVGAVVLVPLGVVPIVNRRANAWVRRHMWCRTGDPAQDQRHLRLMCCGPAGAMVLMMCGCIVALAVNGVMTLVRLRHEFLSPYTSTGQFPGRGTGLLDGFRLLFGEVWLAYSPRVHHHPAVAAAALIILCGVEVVVTPVLAACNTCCTPAVGRAVHCCWCKIVA